MEQQYSSSRVNLQGLRLARSVYFSAQRRILAFLISIALGAPLALFYGTPAARMDSSLGNVIVGVRPFGVAVNPLTNKIYVANAGRNNVTVIDGANNATTTVAAGASPEEVAVNPVTNKIYVVNGNSSNVTVIDGANNSTQNVIAGTVGNLSVAINPVTNKIYVVNVELFNGFVTVIDGASNSTQTVAVGPQPIGVAVNPVTNKIYVANAGTNGTNGSLTVIDGANNATTTVMAGQGLSKIAVNQVTNKIYAISEFGNNVAVVDGANNSTQTIAVGSSPSAIAVNPLTNKIYVCNFNSNNVTVINGANNSTQTIPAGTRPVDVAVNQAANKIYVANLTSNNVTIIDGANNTTQTIAAGTVANTVAVNPVTSRSYVANSNSNNVTVIDGAPPAQANAIDLSPYFVQQQYLDFLNRLPDDAGLIYWTEQLNQCGPDINCLNARRIGVSAAFFIELEFQQTGSVVYRFYRAAYGALPPPNQTRANIIFAQFGPDRSRLIAGPQLEQSTIDFANQFVQRSEFLARYPTTQTNAQFVNLLFDTANLTPFTAERQAEIDAMNNSGRTRAQVLRNVINITAFANREFNPSFVLMQYFGYLRRDPDQGGYDFWLGILNQQPQNARGMVCAFITSAEYQLRFGTAVTRTNALCGGNP